MSIIVYSPKEMCIVADTFVFHTHDHIGKVKETDFQLGDKIKTTEDNHFIYAFEVTQVPQMIPVITNFLKRFEMGLLGKDEVLQPYKDEEFELGIMSKRRVYRVVNNKKGINVYIKNNMFTNHYNSFYLLHTLELPALEVWKVMVREVENVAHNTVHTTASAKKLKLISKQKKAKTEHPQIKGETAE